MSDPTEECPPGFRLYNKKGIKACGRPASSPTNSCQTVKFHPIIIATLKYVIELLHINMDRLMLLTLMEDMTSMEHMLIVLVSLVVILIHISGHLWLPLMQMLAMMTTIMTVPVLLTVLLVSLL